MSIFLYPLVHIILLVTTVSNSERRTLSADNLLQNRKSTNTPSFHLITYATKGYFNCARVLAGTGLKNGGFDVVKIYRPHDLDDFFRERNEFILSHNRGGGLWLYKPYVIMYHMLYMSKENDLICYMDANYRITRSLVPSLLRLTAAETRIGIYKGIYRPDVYVTTLTEKVYSKNDAFLLMGLNNETFRETEQAWAGFVVFARNFHSQQFIAEWLTYAQDHRIITDESSVFGKEDSSFQANRHDQTILSLLSKKWGIPLQIRLPSEKGSFVLQEVSFILNMPDGQVWSLPRWEPDGADVMKSYCKTHYSNNVYECEEIAEKTKSLEQNVFGKEMLPDEDPKEIHYY